jgi:hypothetical protein
MSERRSKTPSLAQFTQAPAPAAPTPTSRPGERTRGKGEFVGITLRLTREQWDRMHDLARAEGISLQALTLRGLSQLFEARGLPPL